MRGLLMVGAAAVVGVLLHLGVLDSCGLFCMAALRWRVPMCCIACPVLGMNLCVCG